METHIGVTPSTVSVTHGNWRSSLSWTSTSSETRSWVQAQAWGPIRWACMYLYMCVCCCRTDCIMWEHCSSLGSKINSQPLHSPSIIPVCWIQQQCLFQWQRGMSFVGDSVRSLPFLPEWCTVIHATIRTNCSWIGFNVYLYSLSCALVFGWQHTLAEVWVQKTSEMDTSQQYHCRTFLGHLLNIGDLVMGWVWRVCEMSGWRSGWLQRQVKAVTVTNIYFWPCRFDFANSNVNDEYLNKMNPHHVPDVVRPECAQQLLLTRLRLTPSGLMKYWL